jgi:hypothetical protein
MDVEAAPGAEVLVQKVLPYFDRTYQHFCSHRQTPSSGVQGGPAVVRKGRAIYFANPIFTEYNGAASRWVKVMFLNAIELLMGEPLVKHGGPTTLQVSVNEQPAEKRWVVHLLHYIPERRGIFFDVIEDVIPLYNVAVSVRAPKPAVAVRLAPEGTALPFKQANGRLEFVVPQVNGHQMVELAF